MTIKCAVPDCQTTIDPCRWACLRHWFMLPETMQADLIEIFQDSDDFAFNMLAKEALNKIAEVERDRNR